MTACKCGSKDPAYRCGWKLRTTFMVSADSIIPGDKVQCGIAWTRVLSVKFPSAAWVDIQTDLKMVSVKPKTAILTLRIGACGTVCCVNCAREVAEGHHVCRAHWDAWELRDAVDQRMEVFNG